MTPAEPRVVYRPFFLRGVAGRLFALHLQAAGDVVNSRGVLFFPPFAEEMNKSRRMVALQARRLAAMGYQVLLVDLYGTGDSEGDFADARWSMWRADMLQAALWLQKKGADRLTLWGLRLGSLLAMEIEPELRSSVDSIVLWQPVARGSTFMTQFLRLRVAGEMVSGGDKLTTRDLRHAFRRGDCVEIAGYTVHPEMAEAIDLLSVEDLIGEASAPLACFQVTLDGEPSGIGRRLVALREPKGNETSVVALTGEKFWQSAGIAVHDELLNLSSKWLEGLF